jgi:hypothetical protein
MPEDPDAADAREWLRLARSGDLAAAWLVSDRIRSRGSRIHDWSQPRHLQQIWNGCGLAGKRVLIRCYHGLGDTIQFIRYTPLVKAIARDVTVWVQPALMSILATATGIDRLVPLHDGSYDLPYDVDIEIMELPYAFRTSLADVPASVPYLHAVPRPLSGSGGRVGIVWRAGDWDRRRSLPRADLMTLLGSGAVTWYALQQDVRADEQCTGLTVLDTRGIAALAEAMRGLDLVISIDSMPAHLAGALAVPVWTLLPYDADWRWMQHRSDTPWYPTMRLFRQHRPGDWAGTLAEVGQALNAWAARFSG